MTSLRSDARLQESLNDVTRLLEKHRVLETMTHRQEGPRRDLLESLQHRQNLAELKKRLVGMHSADIAHVLEALPLEQRLTVWEQVGRDSAGLVLIEVSDAVRASLVEALSSDDLVEVLATLDPDDLAFLSASLPSEIVERVARALDARDRTTFENVVFYPDDSVGHYMSGEFVAVADGNTMEQTLADLRARGQLPSQTDRIFVVDARNVLRGAVTLQALLLRDPEAPVIGAIDSQTVTFNPSEEVSDAARAFERYDLVSAPVVDDRGKLIGRLTVDAVMDFVRDEAELRALKRAGLTGEEDMFAAPWDSARNRWPWLAINLVTAFVASRVIGQFEGVIRQVAALAALMPIVASIGGNTGNQTMALVIRGLATDRLTGASTRGLLFKELTVGVMNGALWGMLVGGFAVALYSNFSLGLVMSTAVVLNLLVAAVAGVTIPLGLHAAGRDPAHGASVLLTFITDGMGFFLFLGLATLFLV